MIYRWGRQLINHFSTKVSSWRLHFNYIKRPVLLSKLDRCEKNLFDLRQDSYDWRIIHETGKNVKEVHARRGRSRKGEFCGRTTGLAQKKVRGRMGPNINRVGTHVSLARGTRNADQYTAIMHRIRRNVTVIRRRVRLLRRLGTFPFR